MGPEIKHSILIVDDDGTIREGLANSIAWEENGITLLGTAGDGEMALRLIEKKRPDLILSDIKMPFLDGIQLAETVLKRYPDTR